MAPVYGEIDAVKIFSANDDNLTAIHPDDFSKVLENAISAARPWCTYSVPNNVWLVRVIKGFLPTRGGTRSTTRSSRRSGRRVSALPRRGAPAPPAAPARALAEGSDTCDLKN